MNALERPSSLAVFATVAASGVVGLLIYAGLFYANQRRASSGSDVEAVSPAFDTQQQAQQEVDRWIQDGGTYTVTSTQRIQQSVPLTRQERRKLELLADEQRRAKIEASYEACLNEAASDLAKELCSFQQTPDIAGSAVPGLDAASEIPDTKVIETLRVERKDHPRRTCTLVQDYRRFNCVEFDVSAGAEVDAGQQSSLAIKAYRQFRF